MADVGYYLSILLAEARRKITSLDGTISATSTLSMGELKRISTLMNTTLKENPIVKVKLQTGELRVGYVAPSAVTLRRYLVYNFVPGTPLDERVIKTLNLFSWFVNYESWDDFIKVKQRELNVGTRSLEEMLIEVISNASKAEFNAYFGLPEINTEELEKYFVPDGPALKRIKGVLRRSKKQNLVINNPDNPSHRDIYAIHLMEINANTAVFEVIAYWYIRWINIDTGWEPDSYNVGNTQIMRLDNINGTWKVATNFYQPYSDDRALKVIQSNKPIA